MVERMSGRCEHVGVVLRVSLRESTQDRPARALANALATTGNGERHHRGHDDDDWPNVVAGVVAGDIVVVDGGDEFTGEDLVPHLVPVDVEIIEPVDETEMLDYVSRQSF